MLQSLGTEAAAVVTDKATAVMTDQGSTIMTDDIAASG
jgi:hypothetical protein